MDSLKVLDPEGPIREADIGADLRHVSFVPGADSLNHLDDQTISAWWRSPDSSRGPTLSLQQRDWHHIAHDESELSEAAVRISATSTRSVSATRNRSCQLFSWADHRVPHVTIRILERVMMKSFRVYVTACIFSLLASAIVSIPSAFAVEIPSDHDQDVMIRSTLATFNDANMSNNYAVMWSKASRQLQVQVTPEKFQTAFAVFRDKQIFFEEIVTADRESSEKAKIDEEGVLVLAGAFKTDEMLVKYRLRYALNSKIWKLLGINVDTTKK